MTIGTYALSIDRVSVMSFTRSYMQHAFVFAFAESAVFSTPIGQLLAPFQDSVWMLIALLLVISILFILLSKRLSAHRRHFIIGGRMNRTPVLNMLNALIGNVIPNRMMTQPTYFSTFSRTLTILWLLFWLIVRNAYEGSLYESLQSQRAKPLYDTVEEVRKSGAKINVISSAVGLIPDGFDRKKYFMKKKKTI